MEQTTPTLPTVIITTATPLPPISTRSSFTAAASPDRSQTHAGPSRSPMLPHFALTDTEKLSLAHGHLLVPPATSRKRSKKSKPSPIFAVQIGLLLIAALLVLSGTTSGSEFGGPTRILRRMIPSLSSRPSTPQVMEIINSTDAGIPIQSEVRRKPKVKPMSQEAWKAYLAQEQGSYTSVASRASTVEVWDFH